ncbi:hypothetical protein ACF0H5_013165 [Mactra antiquata]
MDSKTQTSFSIEYLTKDGLQKNTSENYQSDGVQNGDIGKIYRRTPSPSDSGMESDQSPARPTSIGNDDSIIQTRTFEKVFQNFTAGTDKKAVDDKPTHSYIALISMAILSSPHRRMLLSDIYQYVMDKYSFYKNDEKAWRNSIRHNLSLNECFIKAGRAENGKGNFWTIHPACVDDFANGDFRRRQARRRARKNFKEPSQTRIENSSSLHHYMRYVPMTASHLSYHPYSSPSFYYPQSPSLAQNFSQQSSNQSLSTSYDTSSSMNATHITTPVSVMSAVTQDIFRDQSNAMSMTMPAFAAQQQLANSIQFQNLHW